MWNPFKKTNTSVISSNAGKTNWRQNMWVMAPEGVGILFKMDPVTNEVHLVNTDGTTKISVFHHQSALRQATLAEIPESRRPSKEVAERLGY